MSRCVICDHEDGYANTFLHLPQNNGNRVRLRSHPHHELREYICDNCYASYKYAVDDLGSGGETETPDQEAPSTMSLREVI